MTLKKRYPNYENLKWGKIQFLANQLISNFSWKKAASLEIAAFVSCCWAANNKESRPA
jgi:hypothetical protein